MNPEFSAFLSANGTAIVIVLGVLAAVGLVQWRKVRIAEQEQEYKQSLLDKGVSPVEIERTLAAKAPPRRRGLLEQFGELSGGGKAGVVIVIVVVVSVVTGSISAVMHSQTFSEHVRAQQAAQARQAELQPMPPLTLPTSPFDTIAGNVDYLDLQPVANQKLMDTVGDGHSFANLPQKRQNFGGVPFQIGPSYVRLRGKNHKELPPEVTEIHLGYKLDKLHILHGTEFGSFGGATHKYHVPEGTEIAYYRIGYADQDEVKIPVVYGQDVRDSWNWDNSRPTKRGKVVWTGSCPGAIKQGVSLRLYLTTWENPRPDEEVTSIDFVSTCNTAASPFCIALTAERKTK